MLLLSEASFSIADTKVIVQMQLFFHQLSISSSEQFFVALYFQKFGAKRAMMSSGFGEKRLLCLLWEATHTPEVLG